MMNPPLPESGPLLPEVRAVQRDGDSVRLALHVPVALAHFPGHFPGLALLPGMVQVDWAVRLGSEHLPVAGKFTALEALKFNALVLPGSDLQLDLRWNGGKLSFAYHGARGKACSSGRLVFAESTA